MKTALVREIMMHPALGWTQAARCCLSDPACVPPRFSSSVAPLSGWIIARGREASKARRNRALFPLLRIGTSLIP